MTLYLDKANAHSTLPGPPDDNWIEWQTMESYKEGDVALTMASADEQLFGFTRDGVWSQMLDGKEYPKPDYKPTRWTNVPQERWGDFALGQTAKT